MFKWLKNIKKTINMLMTGSCKSVGRTIQPRIMTPHIPIAVFLSMVVIRPFIIEQEIRK